MRILVIGSFAPSLIHFRGKMLERFIVEGHEVKAIAPDLDDTTREKLSAMGVASGSVALERTGLNLFADLVYCSALTKHIRDYSPSLVLTYTAKPNIWGAFAAKRAGVRSVALITGLGFVFSKTEKKNLKVELVRKLARALYKRAAGFNWRVIFQNPDDCNDFIAAGCLVDRSKVGIINGSGVDLKEFVWTPLPDKPEFLMVSRILRAKGVREYTQAAFEVKKTHPDARFKLVGFFDEGPDSVGREELQRWLDGGVEYLGPSDDVRPHLAACRVFVLPSYREGTPRSVLEAMATGRAILTSDAPGCRETVVDGLNGFLVPVRDADTLANKMRWMIENPEGCERMAAESLRIVREKYDVDKVNKVLLHYLGLGK